MHGRLWTPATPLLALLLCAAAGPILAAERSTDEAATIEAIQEKINNSTGCPINSDVASLAEYCSNAACVSLIEEVIDELPDCEYFGLNMREILASEFAECGNRSSSASASADEVGSWSVGGTECTADEVQTTETILSSVDQVAECQDSASETWTLSSSSTSYDLCATTTAECVEALTAQLADLPDCTVDGFNAKSFIDSILAACASGSSQGSSAASTAWTLSGYRALTLLFGVVALVAV